MRWLLKRGWMYVAMLVVSAFALFPVYWVVITSLKPRVGDLHAHARSVAERSAVVAVPARARARATSGGR